MVTQGLPSSQVTLYWDTFNYQFENLSLLDKDNLYSIHLKNKKVYEFTLPTSGRKEFIISNITNTDRRPIISEISINPIPFSLKTGVNINYHIINTLSAEHFITLTIFNLNGEIIKSFKTINNEGSFYWKGSNKAQVYMYKLNMPDNESITGLLLQIK